MKSDEHDKVILKLSCAECDNLNCKVGKKIIPDGSKTGCTRWVTEEEFSQFVHYMTEVIPFWPQHSFEYVNQSYWEIYNFLLQIYKYPIVNMLDNKGKVIGG